MATKKSCIQRAVDMYGGSPSALAAAVGGDVTRQNIEHWLRLNRVPHGRCARLAIVTGISVEALDPLHDWDTVRQALSLKAA